MQVGITINIVDYFPNDFDFSDFNFIFIYETKQIDKEITYLKKNNIYHKLFIPGKKDIKYSVRMLRNDSLIGLSEFTIPFSVFHKKQTNYEKNVLIQMTDSLKKLIFGSSISNNQIKINIHSSLQYLDGPFKEKSLRKNKSNVNNEIYEKKLINTIKEREPKSNRVTNFKLEYNNLSTSNNRKDGINILKRNLQKNYKITIKDQCSNPFPHTQVSSPKRHLHNIPSTELKKHINLNLNTNANINYHVIKDSKDVEEEIDETNINDEDPNDKSLIDKDIETEEQYGDKKLYEFIDSLIKENPLSELDNKKDMGEMIIYTQDIISQLLDYQIKFYETLKKSIDMNHKLNELLLKYNEKYRYIIKKMNKLKEKSNTHDMKNEIIINNNKNDKNNINEIINIKNKELDIFKDIYKIPIEGNEIIDLNSKDNNSMQLNILLNALQKISSKYGPLNELMTAKNSTENEIGDLNHILNKYKEHFTINKSNSVEIINITENVDLNNLNNEYQNETEYNNKGMEYVLSDNPDELDKVLNRNLRNIYNNNKKLPKVLFKRIGKNTYEYGTQKVLIKREDTNIKVRYGGIFSTLDRFIDTNSMTEYGKKTQTHRNNSKKLTNISK